MKKYIAKAGYGYIKDCPNPENFVWDQVKQFNTDEECKQWLYGLHKGYDSNEIVLNPDYIDPEMESLINKIEDSIDTSILLGHNSIS